MRDSLVVDLNVLPTYGTADVIAMWTRSLGELETTGDIIACYRHAASDHRGGVVVDKLCRGRTVGFRGGLKYG